VYSFLVVSLDMGFYIQGKYPSKVKMKQKLK
jgi:hypothetical protein